MSPLVAQRQNGVFTPLFAPTAKVILAPGQITLSTSRKRNSRCEEISEARRINRSTCPHPRSVNESAGRKEQGEAMKENVFQGVA